MPATYFLKDPSIPLYKYLETLPITGVPDTAILQTFLSNRKQISANLQCTLASSIIDFKSILPNNQIFTSWAENQTLLVNPSKIKGIATSYDRNELGFSYRKFGIENFCSANNANVVAHSLGHAFLDAIRPDIWNVNYFEVVAFQEAFAEINAISSMLSWKELALEAVNNREILSKTAVDVGNALKFIGMKPYNTEDFWGNAINDFTYMNHMILPLHGSLAELTQEPENFARIWISTWWNILIEIAESLSNPFEEALVLARNIINKYQIEAFCYAPFNPDFFATMAGLILDIASVEQTYYEIIKSNFEHKGIITDAINYHGTRKFNDFDFKNYRTLTSNKRIRVIESRPEKIRLSNHYEGSYTNEYHDVLIPVIRNHHYTFNEKGELLFEIKVSSEEIIDGLIRYIHCLDKNNLIGERPKATHYVKDEVLERKQFICKGLNYEALNGNNYRV